jgi:phosphatidylglycerol:prolipoprotein diacylglycerol transferase
MFTFHLYGFFIGLGILAGAWVAEEIRKFLNTKTSTSKLNISIFDLVIWVVIWAVVGARFYHVINYWNYYSKNLVEILYLWQGGLGIYGAILGGILGIWIFIKLKPQSSKLKAAIQNLKLFWQILDLCAFGLPVGQAIGRVGNYFNQELYGVPTNLPWGIYIRPENRVAGFENIQYFQPLFAYEAIWDLFIFITLLLLIRFKDKIKPGFFFFSYLFLYACGRFFLEFLRINPWQVGGVVVAQAISVILILVSLVVIVKKYGK